MVTRRVEYAVVATISGDAEGTQRLQNLPRSGGIYPAAA